MVDEAAAFVIEAEAKQDVGVLQAPQPRPLKQPLMDRDGFADLSLLAIQVAENHVHFERVRVEACSPAQLLDREVDLIGDHEIQPEDVVRRFAGASPIDPFAVAQLVALPRFADGQAEQQCDQRAEQRCVVTHGLFGRAATGGLSSM